MLRQPQLEMNEWSSSVAVFVICLCTTNSGGVMLVRTQKNDEGRLIDFLNSAPADWNPSSDSVMTPIKQFFEIKLFTISLVAMCIW